MHQGLMHATHAHAALHLQLFLWNADDEIDRCRMSSQLRHVACSGGTATKLKKKKRKKKKKKGIGHMVADRRQPRAGRHVEAIHMQAEVVHGDVCCMGRRRTAAGFKAMVDATALLSPLPLLQYKYRIQEQIKELKGENLRLSEALLNLTKEVLENKPLTKRQLEDLIIKITERPKQVEQQALQLSEELKQKATNSYKEALQATEGIESPAVGFCKPADYKGGGTGKNHKEVMATQRNPPVTTITRTEGAPLFEDQVREYRQGQRRRYNAQRAIQRVARRVTGGSYNNALEQQLDPQTQLRLSMQERASIVPAEVLYHSRRDDAHHRVYVHRSEEAVLVTSNQVDRAFTQPESFNQLQRSGMRFLHMGVIQVRIQILHRQEEGTLALVVFRDNRWQGDQAIFATMEIDLTHGSQLVYVIPDTMLTISDFYRNIQVSILARGYENWRNGEANLLITRGLVGRLSNTPNVGFAYEIQNVVDYLASHGVRALPGRSYNTRDVLGHNWIIRQSTVNIPMQPTEVNTRNMLDGSVSLQFDQYQAATSSSLPKFNSKDEEIQSDEEELTSHTIAVLVEEERGSELLVKRIHLLAQLPIRRTSGSAGYDISITDAQNIPALGRSLLQTECIAQLILEQISAPEVREVELLSSTKRGAFGFGSTNQATQVCSSTKANPFCQGCQNCCSDEEFHTKPGFLADFEEYITTRTKGKTQKGKEVIQDEAPVKRVSGYQPLSEEQMLAFQQKARQSMDPVKRRRINYPTVGGSNSAVTGQAQQQGSFISGEPYHFLAQYKEVSCSQGPWVCTTHEEDARRHLADIEKTVADQLIHNILELKLIHDIKEADFSIRGEHSKGLYFKDALPSVIAVKTSLFNTFLQLQNTIQDMVDTPP
ncbi:hypothetical protein ZIOFF_060908 [Zingiber officinale]|uniref:Polyprotein n=1 Tax=Zingiber officinale TaxID=94328 RepID=A0A8J5KLF0_ZINOF|nr:hypothetical protein ZIOFF_060908 [Zingiber officinale]